MVSTAYFSANRRFRYTLVREWDAAKPKVAFIGLNPSTADETEDDPTIRRCIAYAKAWGKGGLLMLNMYAYRATKPKDMWAAEKRGVDIIGGQENWVESLKRYATYHACDLAVAAWGRHGMKRGPHLSAQWPSLTCLGFNDDGTPKHPLYLKADLRPINLSQQVQL
jgi:hypothetical protein